MKLNIDMLRDLTGAFGPSGFEEEVVEVIGKYCRGMNVANDAMNNVYAWLADRDSTDQDNINLNNTGRVPADRKKPVIMLDAHTDECGFMVQGIMDNGLLNMIMLGGMDLASLPAHTVLIRTESGKKVRGIITSRPVHFMTEKEKNAPLDIQELYIDVGASSRAQVQEQYGIRVGAPAAPEVGFEYDREHGMCFGKAFDNRMGCACIIHTMEEIRKLEQEPAVDVVGAFAAQEEVGMRGAAVTSARVQPDLAIVFEGSPADDFYYGKEKAQGVLGAGVQIRCMDKSYITNPAFLRYAHELGDTLGIPYQDTVRRGGSTNAGKISLAGRAVPTLVLGIPSRYVHSHYNFCAAGDVQAAVKMAVEVIRGLDSHRIDLLMRKDILGRGL
ncbi:M42 family metallopeptidase [Enterocloster citroniae]|uniref:M42 family metallopeptidase n=1 Tax=Enterocloster citroniae TaxID=358743 RepID=UPI00349EBDF6